MKDKIEFVHLNFLFDKILFIVEEPIVYHFGKFSSYLRSTKLWFKIKTNKYSIHCTFLNNNEFLINLDINVHSFISAECTLKCFCLHQTPFVNAKKWRHIRVYFSTLMNTYQPNYSAVCCLKICGSIVNVYSLSVHCTLGHDLLFCRLPDVFEKLAEFVL